MSTPLRMILTGCASGIGRHLSGALSSRGHRVLATDVNEVALAEAAEAGGWSKELVRRKKLDVRSEADWDAAFTAAEEAFGGVDVLLNIAGYLHPAYVADVTTKDVDLHLDVNVKGVILGTRAAATRMTLARAGHIVNIGSLASLSPVPGLSLYSASKFAVRGFTLSAAMELKSHGVAVTLIMPDAVQTPMLDKQVGHEEAALTFSGPKALTVEDIERVVLEHVLPDRPLEVALPFSRGALARFANTLPGVAMALAPRLLAAGRKQQERIKKKG
ncbi:MAG: SDR family oxidoreductase [Byssovorax sp.]